MVANQKQNTTQGELMKPLFMWAGGKTKMIKKYKEYLPETFDSYCEPFFGGGAMFVWAYKKNPQAYYFLNDSNTSIINIYYAIKHHMYRFIERMEFLSEEYLPLSKEDRKKMYYELRQEHAYDYEKWDKTTEAATLYFLMKTGFNGIWQINKNTNNRYGTPAGLLNQKDKVYDKKNVVEWNRALQKCVLTNLDFSLTLPFVDDGAFVFLDPPYRGSFTNYGTQSDDEFQASVAKHLDNCKKKGAYTLLSNRHIGDNFFLDKKGENEIVYFDVTYTAGRRKKTKEGYEAKKAVEILLIGNGLTI